MTVGARFPLLGLIRTTELRCQQRRHLIGSVAVVVHRPFSRDRRPLWRRGRLHSRARAKVMRRKPASHDSAAVRYAACRRADRRHAGGTRTEISYRLPRFSLLAFAALLLTIGTASVPALAGDVFVHGHTQRDGTYVPPHWRSAPDGGDNDDWTKALKVNPYTGQQGTRAPDVPDMQWRRPVPEFGDFGNQNF